MNLIIDTGEISLTINDDQNRVIRFNPSSIEFAEAFCGLTEKLEALRDRYNEKIKELDVDTETDSYNIPKNAKERFSMIREICNELKQDIDKVFGAGTSKTVFGDASSFDMFEQFFSGIIPHVQKARAEKMQKYTGNKVQKRAVLK